MPHHSVLIGVAGGSGSGKTTVVTKLVDALGAARVSVIEHDRYYCDHPNLRLEERARLNFDHPDALETSLLVEHLRALRSGRTVDAPIYDFTRHTRLAASDRIAPTPAIIVEGILILADEALRELLDVKIFVDTDDDTRFIRRLQRDVAERGRTVQSVIDQYTGSVKPMHLQFVEPSKRHADLIVPEGGNNTIAIEALLTLIRSMAGPAPAKAVTSRRSRSRRPLKPRR